MTIAFKRKIVIAALLALGVWPAVHRVLIPRLDLNPWKWFGWSMYCVPPTVIKVYTFSGASGRELPFGELSPGEQAALRRVYDVFGKQRVEWGRWVRPDGFARALFDAYPGEDHIEIVVQRLRLNRQSALFSEERRDSYRYDRQEKKD
jgi:hypothetical protein